MWGTVLRRLSKCNEGIPEGPCHQRRANGRQFPARVLREGLAGWTWRHRLWACDAAKGRRKRRGAEAWGVSRCRKAEVKRCCCPWFQVGKVLILGGSGIGVAGVCMKLNSKACRDDGTM